MQQKVDLYDNAYGKYELDAYVEVRVATYGEDFGQTSWVTSEESREIPRLLELTPDSSALEIGCGSGRYALHVAETTGCNIVGLDINASGVRNANRLAHSKNLADRASFEECDVSKKLSCDDCTFDAVFSNDAMCHIFGRAAVLAEINRVLKPAGRMLFSDALVIGGTISHQEIATRSAIGFYVFSPPGENERLMKQAGFRGIRATDTTENAAQIADRWRAARDQRKEKLIAAEGATNFEGLQRFLSCVHNLTKERRLLRYLYFATK